MGVELVDGSWQALPGSHYSTADAQVIGPELMRLAAQQGVAEFSELPTHVIFDAAHDPQSPLHSYFEWDQDKGWREHNLSIARNMVNSIRVTVVKVESHRRTEFVLPAFVSIRQQQQRSYRPIQEVLENPVFLEQARREAIRQAKNWRAKYERYAAFGQFCDLVPLFDLINELDETVTQTQPLEKAG